MATPRIGAVGQNDLQGTKVSPITNGPTSAYTIDDIAKAWDSLYDKSGSAKDPSAYTLGWNNLSPQDQQYLYQKLASDPYQMFLTTPKMSQDTVDFFTGQGRFFDSSNPVSLNDAARAYGNYYFGSPQVSVIQSLAPEIAAKYGITQEYANDALTNLLLRNDKIDSAEWQGMDKEAALMAATVLSAGAASGAFSGATAGEGAAAGSAASSGSAWGGLGDIAAGSGASSAGYAGTAGELAADGLGGVDMAGSSAYYDAGSGMWIDEVTGQGISSGASVPTGYSAEAGQIANAAANTAPSLSADSWLQQLSNYGSQASDWLKQGNNAANVANALKTFSQTPTASGGQSFSSGAPSSFGGSSSSPSQSGAVSSASGQSMLLDNPTSSMIQESSPVQQQAQPLGMIDISPANNTFLQAGSTWNQQMANALRNRNAY